jgi:hypothetical protein
MEIDVYAEYAGYPPSFTEVSNFLLPGGRATESVTE